MDMTPELSTSGWAPMPDRIPYTVSAPNNGSLPEGSSYEIDVSDDNGVTWTNVEKREITPMGGGFFRKQDENKDKEKEEEKEEKPSMPSGESLLEKFSSSL